MLKIDSAAIIASSVLALCVTVFARADDVSAAKQAGIQAMGAGSSDAAGADDDMASFLTVVAGVLVENDQSDDLANSSHSGDRVSAATAGDVPAIAGRLYQRHLGLGFAHGMSNLTGSGQRKPNDNDPAEFIPPTDVCQGNGHIGIPGAFASAIGHTDCGDPSPSD